MAVEKLIFKERKPRCTDCGTHQKMLLWSNQMAPACACGGQLEGYYDFSGLSPAVIQDSIEGGLEIHHGLCNPDGSPRRYYSKSEIRREAAARGLINYVEHVPERGSDRSPHTSRWV